MTGAQLGTLIAHNEDHSQQEPSMVDIDEDKSSVVRREDLPVAGSDNSVTIALKAHDRTVTTADRLQSLRKDLWDMILRRGDYAVTSLSRDDEGVSADASSAWGRRYDKVFSKIKTMRDDFDKTAPDMGSEGQFHSACDNVLEHVRWDCSEGMSGRRSGEALSEAPGLTVTIITTIWCLYATSGAGDMEDASVDQSTPE